MSEISIKSWAESFYRMDGGQHVEATRLLISMLNCYELRLVATFIEDSAKRDYASCRQNEDKANDPNFLSRLVDLSDVRTVSHLVVCVALIHSTNFAAAEAVFAVLNDWAEVGDNISKCSSLSEQLSLLYTCACNHPAFSIHQQSQLRGHKLSIEKLRIVNRTNAKDLNFTNHIADSVYSGNSRVDRECQTDMSSFAGSSFVRCHKASTGSSTDLDDEIVQINNHCSSEIDGLSLVALHLQKQRSQLHLVIKVLWSDGHTSTITRPVKELQQVHATINNQYQRQRPKNKKRVQSTILPSFPKSDTRSVSADELLTKFSEYLSLLSKGHRYVLTQPSFVEFVQENKAVMSLQADCCAAAESSSLLSTFSPLQSPIKPSCSAHQITRASSPLAENHAGPSNSGVCKLSSAGKSSSQGFLSFSLSGDSCAAKGGESTQSASQILRVAEDPEHNHQKLTRRNSNQDELSGESAISVTKRKTKSFDFGDITAESRHSEAQENSSIKRSPELQHLLNVLFKSETRECLDEMLALLKQGCATFATGTLIFRVQVPPDDLHKLCKLLEALNVQLQSPILGSNGLRFPLPFAGSPVPVPVASDLITFSPVNFSAVTESSPLVQCPITNALAHMHDFFDPLIAIEHNDVLLHETQPSKDETGVFPNSNELPTQKTPATTTDSPQAATIVRGSSKYDDSISTGGTAVVRQVEQVNRPSSVPLYSNPQSAMHTVESIKYPTVSPSPELQQHAADGDADQSIESLTGQYASVSPDGLAASFGTGTSVLPPFLAPYMAPAGWPGTVDANDYVQEMQRQLLERSWQVPQAALPTFAGAYVDGSYKPSVTVTVGGLSAAAANGPGPVVPYPFYPGALPYASRTASDFVSAKAAHGQNDYAPPRGGRPITKQAIAASLAAASSLFSGVPLLSVARPNFRYLPQQHAFAASQIVPPHQQHARPQYYGGSMSMEGRSPQPQPPHAYVPQPLNPGPFLATASSGSISAPNTPAAHVEYYPPDFTIPPPSHLPPLLNASSGCLPPVLPLTETIGSSVVAAVVDPLKTVSQQQLCLAEQSSHLSLAPKQNCLLSDDSVKTGEAVGMLRPPPLPVTILTRPSGNLSCLNCGVKGHKSFAECSNPSMAEMERAGQYKVNLHSEDADSLKPKCKLEPSPTATLTDEKSKKAE